jgi:hypothetical protein
MKRFSIGLLLGVKCHPAAAGASDLLVRQFASSAGDRRLQAAMSAALFLAPAGAITGFVTRLMMGARSRDAASARTQVPASQYR